MDNDRVKMCIETQDAEKRIERKEGKIDEAPKLPRATPQTAVRAYTGETKVNLYANNFKPVEIVKKTVSLSERKQGSPKRLKAELEIPSSKDEKDEKITSKDSNHDVGAGGKNDGSIKAKSIASEKLVIKKAAEQAILNANKETSQQETDSIRVPRVIVPPGISQLVDTNKRVAAEEKAILVAVNTMKLSEVGASSKTTNSKAKNPSTTKETETFDNSTARNIVTVHLALLKEARNMHALRQSRADEAKSTKCMLETRVAVLTTRLEEADSDLAAAIRLCVQAERDVAESATELHDIEAASAKVVRLHESMSQKRV